MFRKKVGFFVINTVILNMNGINYVRMRYGMNDLFFLLDTGASISVIFSNYLDPKEVINRNKQITINGIAGSTKSIGSCDIALSYENITIYHEFLVMRDLGYGMNGIIGSDFLEKYSAIINFEKFNLSLCVNGELVTIPLESRIDSYDIIPPRCEIIKHFWIDDSDDCVVLSQEVSEGVFTASTIARPKSHMIPVRLLNTNDREIKIKNFRPKTRKLEEFELYHLEKNSISLDRVNKLLDVINISTLNKEEKDSIQKICAKYADVFLLENDPVTVTNICKESITLKQDTKPVYVKPYRLPHFQKAEIDKQIDKMLQDGIIEETKSNWSSPILIVPKKADVGGNKKWRLVIDYRCLNKSIEDDRFPLPNITEILDSLGGAFYFSHLDLTQGYFQVELEPSSRKCTAFTTSKGQFQMTRLPMGLKTSPSSFSRVMTIAMSGLNYESCFVYLDDLIVFGKNLQNHNQNLIKVLNRLRDTNLKLNPVKCKFLKKEILYLGHTISSDGISPDPEKIRVIKNYPTPKDADETKRFVAFANYYRKFIPNFAHIVNPLNKLVRKNVLFTWDEHCQNSFETLKNKLCHPPVLQYPNFSEDNRFILKTDASGYAIGAVLSNADDRPVAYASRTLNKAEINYSTIEKELLSIVFAVKHFRPYLYARKFQIFTDHRPLVYLFGMKNPSSRLTKFRLILEEFDFVINYVKGKENTTADALSRIKIESEDLRNLSGNICVMTRNQCKQSAESNMVSSSENEERTGHPGIVELLKKPENSVELKAIKTDKFLNCENIEQYVEKRGNIIYDMKTNIIYIVSNRSTLALDAELRCLRDICNKYGIPQLYILKCDSNKELITQLIKDYRILKDYNIKICIINKAKRIDCKQTRQLILNDFHILSTAGHAGINRMYANIKKYYFWENLKDDVANFVRKCDDCQRYKHSSTHIEPLTITTTSSSAFQKVYLDLMGPLNQDQDDNRYILTIQCELTKFVEAYPIENKESDTVARAFVNNFILRFGIPQTVVTDQGTEFLAKVFKESANILGIKQINSTAYHHQTLGSLENTHKHLGAYLRIQVSKVPDVWSTWIPFWCFAFNNSVHTETKYTPYELVFGKNCNLPNNTLNAVDPMYNFDNYPIELKFRLQNAWKDARNNLIESKVKRKEKYDNKCCNTRNYHFNDKVMLKSEVGSKLEPLYRGPYKVIKEKPPNVTLKIDNKLVEVHKNRIKPYYK